VDLVERLGDQSEHKEGLDATIVEEHRTEQEGGKLFWFRLRCLAVGEPVPGHHLLPGVSSPTTPLAATRPTPWMLFRCLAAQVALVVSQALLGRELAQGLKRRRLNLGIT
jgi:hypothetical protein